MNWSINNCLLTVAVLKVAGRKEENMANGEGEVDAVGFKRGAGAVAGFSRSLTMFPSRSILAIRSMVISKKREKQCD
jgi:hypothetical protein